MKASGWTCGRWGVKTGSGGINIVGGYDCGWERLKRDF